MADALSRVKRLGLYDTQDPEPIGQEFGHTIFGTITSSPRVHDHYKPRAPLAS